MSLPSCIKKRGGCILFSKGPCFGKPRGKQNKSAQLGSGGSGKPKRRVLTLQHLKMQIGLVAPATWNSAFLLSARGCYLPPFGKGAGPTPLPTWLRQVRRKHLCCFSPQALNGRQFYPPASILRGPLLSLPNWCLPAGALAEFSLLR